MTWMYKSVEFIPPEPNRLEGFVYLIMNKINGKKYIGKKHFWTRRKNKKTGRRETKESDWREYYGSSDDLSKDVELLGKENFTREILYLCFYKKQMSFLEQKEQWDRNVLLTDDYYNTNIAGKFFVRERVIYEAKEKKITSKNDNWRKKHSEWMKDNSPSKDPEVKQKISISRLGDKNPAKKPEVRKAISEAKKGKPNPRLQGRIGIGSIKIQTPKGIFASLTLAAKEYNVSPPTMRAWTKSKPGFTLI